jgi:hypothetical protein
MAEVISGLSAGDRVVLHPSDRVSDGTRVTGARQPMNSRVGAINRPGDCSIGC